MNLVSIIIPVHPIHNRDEILGACLKSIDNQTYPKDKIELILIGDDCNITANSYPKGIKTTIYNIKSHAGVAKTRNKGIDLSKGELLAFIDADCVAQREWLKSLVSGLKDDDIAGCGGKILSSDPTYINKDMIYAKKNILPFAGLGNAIFRKRVLEEIGFLDERFYSVAEDIDLCWRIYLKGYRIEYIPEAEVVHKGTPEVKKLFSVGVAVRTLINKYKKTFNLPHPLQLESLLENIKDDLKKRFHIFEIMKYFIILCGYTYGLLKEKLHLSPELDQVDITDRFLQSASSIRPLAVKIDTRWLIKPNYIIWWRTEDGCRILDLRGQGRYVLEDAAGKLWESMMDRKTEDVIIEQLIDEYKVTECELKKDFEDFIEQLCSQKLLIKA